MINIFLQCLANYKSWEVWLKFQYWRWVEVKICIHYPYPRSDSQAERFFSQSQFWILFIVLRQYQYKYQYHYQYIQGQSATSITNEPPSNNEFIVWCLEEVRRGWSWIVTRLRISALLDTTWICLLLIFLLCSFSSWFLASIQLGFFVLLAHLEWFITFVSFFFKNYRRCFLSEKLVPNNNNNNNNNTTTRASKAQKPSSISS